MRKFFVLDTNVVLHDPHALMAFEDNEVLIPIYVVEEVDTFKKDLSELGRNARHFARTLDQLREEGNLGDGVELAHGGRLRIVMSAKELPNEYQTTRTVDNMILAVALANKEANPDADTILVTKDVNLRVRCDAIGLIAEDYDSEGTDISELYSGIADLEVDGESIDSFYRDGCLDLDDPYYFANQFAFLKDAANPSHTAMGRIDVDEACVLPLRKQPNGMWGIRARNREQAYAAEVLMDDQVKLVTIVGKAGTGKTLLAIAAGLQKVTEESVYQRLLISRPVFPLGKDIGFLPGDIEEKLNPWMQPIFDNVEFLMGLTGSDKRGGRSYHELLDLGILEIEPLTYIRGRSIPHQFLVVDEAQNLTPHEVKTIVSRAGDGTKIVLTGDPYQIDNPYVDAMNNGLVHVVNRFRGERIAAHISLSKGERSDLAELAANLL